MKTLGKILFAGAFATMFLSCAKTIETEIPAEEVPAAQETILSGGPVEITLVNPEIDTKFSLGEDSGSSIPYTWAEKGDTVIVTYNIKKKYLKATTATTSSDGSSDTDAQSTEGQEATDEEDQQTVTKYEHFVFKKLSEDNKTAVFYNDNSLLANTKESVNVGVFYSKKGKIESQQDGSSLGSIDIIDQPGLKDNLSEYAVLANKDTISCVKGKFSSTCEMTPINLFLKFKKGTKVGSATDGGLFRFYVYPDEPVLLSFSNNLSESGMAYSAGYTTSKDTVVTDNSKIVTLQFAITTRLTKASVKDGALTSDLYVSLVPTGSSVTPGSIHCHIVDSQVKDFKYEIPLNGTLSRGKVYVMPEDLTSYTSKTDKYADKKVTVMVYSVGGGNLDSNEDDIIENSLKRLYSQNLIQDGKVTLTCQMKYSKQNSDSFKKNETAENIMGKPGKTYRYILNKASVANTPFWQKVINKGIKGNEGQLPDSCATSGEAYKDMSTKENLTNFINWSMKKAPADYYVLVIGDHGGGYLPYDGCVTKDSGTASTKGALADDNTPSTLGKYTEGSVTYDLVCSDAQLSYENLASAIAESNLKKVNVLHLNLCISNMLEVMGEFKDKTDYVIGSIHETRSASYSHAKIAEYILSNPDDMGTAVKKFGTYMFENMPAATGIAVNVRDICVTKTSGLDKVFSELKTFSSALTKITEAAATDTSVANKFKKALSQAYSPTASSGKSSSPFYDIGSIVDRFDKYFGSAYNISLSNFMTAMNEAILYERYDCLVWDMCGFDSALKPSWTVNLVAKGEWCTTVAYKANTNIKGWVYLQPENKILYVDDERSVKGTWNSTFADTYGKLYFSTATGWGDWLLKNNYIPQSNPNSTKYLEFSWDSVPDTANEVSFYNSLHPKTTEEGD